MKAYKYDKYFMVHASNLISGMEIISSDYKAGFDWNEWCDRMEKKEKKLADIGVSIHVGYYYDGKVYEKNFVEFISDKKCNCYFSIIPLEYNI